MIELKALTRYFGKKAAVSGLDLVVPTGEVFGFLGPNGAGKTTTIRMMLGLIGASSGSVSLLGRQIPRDFHKIHLRIGAMLEPPTFYPSVSAATNLRLLSLTAARPLSGEDVHRLIDLVGLSMAGKKMVGAFSHGMRQRLGIAVALMHNPDLVILDEPLTGLDPEGIREVRVLIRELGSQGKTVFLSSHLLAEVEQVCTSVGFLVEGHLIGQYSAEALRRSRQVRVVQASHNEAALLTSRGWKVTPDGPDLLVENATRDEVRDTLVAEGLTLVEVRDDTKTLEDLYVVLTSR